MRTQRQVQREAKECLRLPKARREGWNPFSLTPLRGTNPADTLILDFQPPYWGKNTFLLLKLPSVWYFVTAALKMNTEVKGRRKAFLYCLCGTESPPL